MKQIEERIKEIDDTIRSLKEERKNLINQNTFPEYENTYYKEVEDNGVSLSKTYYYIKKLYFEPEAFNDAYIQGIILMSPCHTNMCITTDCYTRKSNLIESSKEEFEEQYQLCINQLNEIREE